MTTEIRSNTVLPARREVFSLHTADGLSLVAEWALPLDAAPRATLVTFHPLPTDGRVHGLAPAAQGVQPPSCPCRHRGAALQHPRHDVAARHERRSVRRGGRSERFDVDAAIAAGLDLGAPPLVLLGWSFGTDLVLKYGRQQGVDAVVLLSPPLRHTSDDELAAWAGSSIPMTVLVPELDDFLRPDEARHRFAVVPQAEVIGVDGAKHLWVGEKYVCQVLNEVASVALGQKVELPQEWGSDRQED